MKWRTSQLIEFCMHWYSREILEIKMHWICSSYGEQEIQNACGGYVMWSLSPRHCACSGGGWRRQPPDMVGGYEYSE